jgi:hypothetical protein
MKRYNGKSMMYVDYHTDDIIRINDINNGDFDSIEYDKHSNSRTRLLYKGMNVICKKDVSEPLTTKTELTFGEYSFSQNIKNCYITFAIIEPDFSEHYFDNIYININDHTYVFSKNTRETKMFLNNKSDTFNKLNIKNFYRCKLVMYINNMKNTIIYNDLPVLITKHIVNEYVYKKNLNDKISYKSHIYSDYDYYINTQRKRKNYNKFKNISCTWHTKKYINFIDIDYFT